MSLFILKITLILAYQFPEPITSGAAILFTYIYVLKGMCRLDILFVFYCDSLLLKPLQIVMNGYYIQDKFYAMLL